MTDLVAAGLARPAAIAVDLARHLERVGAVALDEEVDALLASPALGMDPGVDDEPAAAKRDRLEIAEASDREIVIHAELIHQLLGVQSPAFRISVERKQRTDERQLVRIFALPDVARNRLVRRKVGQAVLAVKVGRPK